MLMNRQPMNPNYLPYHLIIFDLDGTLSEYKTGKLLPGVKMWFTLHAPYSDLGASEEQKFYVALASNQGGVGLRLWMEQGHWGEPQKYPTEPDIIKLVGNVYEALDSPNMLLQVCYAYQSKNGKWSPTPKHISESLGFEWDHDCRKPNPGMLIRAMNIYQISPQRTLMVGNGPEDYDAALQARCEFMDADEFFGR